ncbi:MAG: Nramp family divalent metal transporter [Puniceicoccaceae bacterium]
MQSSRLKSAPTGLALIAALGPGLVWCSEMVGSGEIILTTRTGAVLGMGVLWAIVLGIFLKYWMGLSGAHYTVCTGEGMMDMFARIPGPKNWVVWIVVVVQFIAAALAIGSIASAAGAFVHGLIPQIPAFYGGLTISLLAFGTAWMGGFRPIKILLSGLVAVMVIGVLYVTIQVFPGVGFLLEGLKLSVPVVPEWAIALGESSNPWDDILPLMGWAAGGFASQVWYTYWVIGDGYGATNGRGYGTPADTEFLKTMSNDDAGKIRGWLKMIRFDATIGMSITLGLTICFLIAGSVILRPMQLAPTGPEVATTLSGIFAHEWGILGSKLFMLAGLAALTSTQFAQMAGWPRLLADGLRICVPSFGKAYPWKTQFRIFLSIFFVTNIIIVFSLGFKPVVLVKIAAICDGLLLTPLQALWIAIGLYWVMPRMMPKEAYQIVRPHWIHAVFLMLAFVVFGYFCIFQIPRLL